MSIESSPPSDFEHDEELPEQTYAALNSLGYLYRHGNDEKEQEELVKARKFANKMTGFLIKYGAVVTESSTDNGDPENCIFLEVTGDLKTLQDQYYRVEESNACSGSVPVKSM